MSDNQQRIELIIQALQQRIGELVSNYETQIAILRAELTQSINENNNESVQEEKTDKDN
jgi:sRNA-binding carbon storage regulator CsrA